MIQALKLYASACHKKKLEMKVGKIAFNREEEKVMRNYGRTYLSFCCAAVLGISMQY